MMNPHRLDRRTVLIALGGAAVLALSPSAHAETADMEAAIKAFTGGKQIAPGRVKLDVSPIVENGNSVSVGVDVDHPVTAEAHVKRIAFFNEKNPQSDVAIFHLNPRCGSNRVATRIRLATTQNLAAIAELSDGTFWMDKVEVIVTIAACTEE
jgi:sulfur-oxidizing protein SoxY